MSRETFQSLRMLLMEKLDLARELTDEEILEEIDTLILERMRDSCLSLPESFPVGKRPLLPEKSWKM